MINSLSENLKRTIFSVPFYYFTFYASRPKVEKEVCRHFGVVFWRIHHCRQLSA